MKKFSLLLMIVLIVGAIFVSCSAEPARSSDVATVALSLDNAKALSASSEQYMTMYGADELYWFYKATKVGGGFNFGETEEWKPLYSGSSQPGIPSLIGYKSEGVGALFSTGNWNFEFAGYTSSSPSDTPIYSGSASVEVSTPDEATLIGGHAVIELEVENDPRSDGRVKISNITVDFGETLVSNATYNMSVYVDNSENPINMQPIVGTMAGNSKVVTFAGGDGQIFTFNNDNIEEPLDPGFHTLKFEIKKDTLVYARGEITIATRFGYELTITGSLANLDTVAYVKIDSYTGGTVAENEPVFEISDLAGLKALAAAVNAGDDFKGVTIKLTENINLGTETWTPIGNAWRGSASGAGVFKGTFDGNGYTIYGLTVSEATYSATNTDSDGYYCYGLFGVVDCATITRLSLENVSINLPTKGDSVGAVVGYAIHGVTITDCYVDGEIKGRDAVGGIIGRAYGADGENREFKVISCGNDAAIYANDSSLDSGSEGKAAGIGGFLSPNGKGADNSTLKVIDCKNYGSVTSSTGRDAGIVVYGWKTNMTHQIYIQSNENSGNVSTIGHEICFNASEDSGTNGTAGEHISDNVIMI